MILIEKSTSCGGETVLMVESLPHLPRIGEEIIFDSTLYEVIRISHCIDRGMKVKIRVIVNKIAAYE